jgi:hypothetical protein
VPVLLAGPDRSAYVRAAAPTRSHRDYPRDRAIRVRDPFVIRVFDHEARFRRVRSAKGARNA